MTGRRAQCAEGLLDPRPPFPTLTGEGAARLREAPWRIVIAGAGGWIGLAAIEELHMLLGDAFSARVACFGSTARTLSLRGGLSVDQRPLAAMAELPPAPTILLYLAFLTQEKAALMSREAYAAANAAISDQVFSALDPIGAEAVFVASSGAVELVGQAGADPNKALYGALKLADEERFAGWAERRGGRAAIARIFNLAGPYINKLGSYALACFIADALADRPIEIRSAWPVYRSFVAVDELMSVAFGVMTDGATGATRFDTGAHRGFEMGEIASAVAAALGHTRGVARPPMSATPVDSYAGDSTLYRGLIGTCQVEQIDFPAQVRETARYMASLATAA
jgi:nucleoside-diphosphate-sugar epimerase